MLGSDCRSAVLVIGIAVLAAACGRHDEVGTTPPDTVVPDEHWIEAPDSAGEVREYYKGHLGQKGLETRYGLLVITHKEASVSRTYQLTEYQTNFGKGLTTTGSAGNVKLESFTRSDGEITMYWLDGGTSPGQAQVYVKTDDVLRLTKDPAKHRTAFFVDGPERLDYAAKATQGRVEIYQGLRMAVPQSNIRLRVGDVLTARLWRPDEGTYTLKTDAISIRAALRQQDSRTDGEYQVLTFRAVQPGSTEFVNEYPREGGQPGAQLIARIKVE